MDINFSLKAGHINPDILVQDMVECQNGLNALNKSKLNGIVDVLKSSLQEYFDENHPGLTVPQNGPHFQVMMSSFEELAFLVLEVIDVKMAFEQSESMFDDLLSPAALRSAIDLGSEAPKSILSAVNVVKEKRMYFERCYPQLALKMRKLSDFAKRRIEDISFFGILRGGISSVEEGKAIEGLDLLETLRKAMESTKRQEEMLIRLVQLEMEKVEVVNHVRETLLQARARTTISPDIITALLHFFDLPKYMRVSNGERFRERTDYIFALIKGEAKGEIEIDSLTLESLPFEVLNQLLEMVPSSTDEGRGLRRKMVDDKAIQFVLDYLQRSTEEPEGNYSVQVQEDKLICLLNIVVHFIGSPEDDRDNDYLLLDINGILKDSSFMSVLSGCLEKCSLLDLIGHVALYKVIFKLLGLIASIPQLQSLLISSEGGSHISGLLNKMTNAKDILELMQLFSDIQTTTAKVEGVVVGHPGKAGEVQKT